MYRLLFNGEISYPVSRCVFCEEICYESPTGDPWIKLRYREGIHFRCIDKLANTLESLRRVDEMELRGANNVYTM